ncbi:pPIWI_RE module domain-containing protein [Saccharothrix luteola]|uniref:pPIWI_RE module domain-containing protein n=1 Tax=Saccharothrix luteola TaxID=2893018 RepID=UPI001E59340E|nr:DUF3962 domain-containing protein [Saccharothrix luteola]MCC8245474.1 DUF3962 domain-containing protein [Saccharothrix luteola]
MTPTVRLTAYDLGRDPWSHDFKVIAFAPEWRTEVVRRYAKQFTRADPRWTAPIRQFNSLLQAAVPDVLAAPGAATDDRLPWLYAADVVPRDAMSRLTNAWLTRILSRRGEADGEEVDALLDALDDAMPQWASTSVDLTDTTLTRGGTADPHRRLYHLVPEVVAARLAARTYQYEGTELSFRVVSSTRGTELVSWPPQPYVRRGRDWYHSLLMRASLHTVPFSGRPRVHITYGVRRWVTGEPVKLDPRRGVTAYLQVPLPWTLRDGGVPRLIANGVRHDSTLGTPAWRSTSLMELLPEYSSAFTLPTAEELIDNPTEWAQGRDGVSVWVVHSTLMGSHDAKSGLMPVERRHFDAWVEESLAGVLRRSTDLTKVTLLAKPELWRRDKDAEAKAASKVVKGHARRLACAVALDDRPLTIDIRYENDRTRDALVAALCEVLDLDPASAPHWRTPELEVRLDASTWEKITADLQVPRSWGKAHARAVATATRERRALITRHFGTPALDAPIRLVLVELRGADKFGPGRDPKVAIRLGCADARRVSQFITTETKALAERARSSILDGLRQLGAVLPPKHTLGAAVPPDLQHVGLWMIRKNHTTARTARRALVAVRIRSTDHGRRVEGWDERRKGWVSYPELLLSLHGDVDLEQDRGTWLSLAEQQAAAQRRIRSLLFQTRDTPTLLLVQAGNMRHSWPWLTNSSMVPDSLGFGPWPAQRTALFGPGLRIVVIRDSGGRDEVPQWYAPRDDEKFAGHASGVWQPFDVGSDNRVFQSITEVPIQGAKPNQAVKYRDGAASSGVTVAGWNPEIRELTVLASRMTTTGEPEDPRIWAALAHQLRYADDYVPLAVPLALHLAKLAEEYVVGEYRET